MDIRKWFTSPKAANANDKKSSKPSAKVTEPTEKNKKSKKRIIESDSDDEIPIKKSKDKTVSNGNKRSLEQKSKKPRKEESGNSKSRNEVIELDSDSEDNQRPSPKKSQLKPKTKSSEKVSKPVKTATVSSFFGTAPVQRSNKAYPIPAEKLKVNKVELNHEDGDFAKTLAQLDEPFTEVESKKPEKKVHKEKEEESKKPERKVHKEKEESKKPEKQVQKEVESKEHEKQVQKEVESKKPEKQVQKEKEARKSPRKKPLKKFSSDIEIIPPSPVAKKKIIIEATPPEKKRTTPKGNGANYMSYVQREGPKALGSKEIPQGDGKCFRGKTFVITGVLESIERDEAKKLIESCGAKVTTSLSKKTSHMVVGRDAGASKLEKAETFGTTILSEDGLFDLIRRTTTALPRKEKVISPPIKKVEDQPQGKQSKSLLSEFSFKEAEKTAAKEGKDNKIVPKKSSSSSSPVKVEKASPKMSSPIKSFSEKDQSTEEPSTSSGLKQNGQQSLKRKANTSVSSLEMWVDKYKPTSLKQIIGQQGDKSNAKKLLHWLTNWSRNSKVKKPATFGKWNTNDDGSGFKAALLSGSPGVGKTTTAHLVCKEAGFDFIEFNASDTRSKKSLQNVVQRLLLNKTLSNCFNSSSPGIVSKDRVIIMDEVDGMAGNEDRGGMQELIGFIKTSKIPIICICNDRNHPKIRSLSNYCFDLRFQKPRVEQIKGAMLSIAFKEGIKVSPAGLQEIIIASNQDVRQVLHNLSMWSSCGKALTDEQAKKDIGYGVKHVKMSPFDVLREVFQIGQNKKASLSDKSDLFFHDYSIAPLFVQENYVHVLPTETGGNKQKHLRLLSEAADSICIGDVIDKRIRSQSAWSLLPTQAIFASVIPGELLVGHLKQLISFPSWLGKNSNRNRMDRILQELQMHMRMSTSGNKTDVALEYIPVLQKALTRPLIEKETEGVKDVLEIMKQYYLLREDFDSIIDLSLWPNKTDPRTKINTKVKSAFTRTYNKECTQNPYAASSVAKKKGSLKSSESELVEEEEEVLSAEEEDESIENDAMIKVKKQPAKKQATNEAGPSGSKKAAKTDTKKGRTKK